MDETYLPRIEAEIDRYHRRDRPLSLSFSKLLEQTYCRQSTIERRRSLLRQGLVALAIYDAFIVGDWLMAPAHIMRSVLVRFGIVTPLVLAISWLAQRVESTRLQQAGAAGLCVAGCVSVLFVHSGVGVVATGGVEPGLLLVLLVLNVVLRLELPVASIATAACYGAELLFLYSSGSMTVAEKFTVGGRTFWTAALTLFADYLLLRERRLSWLREMRGQLQSRLLAHSNAELISLSTTDRLTGLANRHAFEDRFAQLWREMAGQRRQISAIIIDIDHFKQINDTFGHLYGDRVLQRVGGLLQQAMREPGDFVARLGGEEFVVLLPNSDIQGARRVGERIRTLVEVAGSPAVEKGDVMPISNHHWCTVSCGIAHVEPAAGMSPQSLIELADRALYRAKAMGRNRVCFTPEEADTVPFTARISRSG